MKNRTLSRPNVFALSLALALAGLSFFTSPSGRAATDTWSSSASTGSWNTAGNWSTLPVTGDSLVFGASSTTTGTDNLMTAGTYTLSGITFLSGASAYTINASGGSGFTLLGNIVNNSTALDTINDPITLSGTADTFTTNSGGGNITIGGVIAGSGAALNVGGLGTLTLTGSNTYTGATTINLGATLNLGGGGSSGSINSGSALVLSGGALNLTTTGGVTQTFNGTTINGGGASSISNTVSSGTLALGALTETTGTGASVNFTNTGAITTTTGNTNGIIGAWATLGNTGTSGATAPWAANSNGSGTGNIVAYTGYTALSSSASTSYSNAQLSSTLNYLSGLPTGNLNGSTGYTTTLTGTGAVTINSLTQQGDFSIDSNQTLVLASGGLVLNGESRWMTNNGNGNTSGSAQLTTGLASGELFVDVPDATSDANNWRIWPKIVDNGATQAILVKNGPGYVRLENANTYSGGTILNAGTIFLSNNGSAGGNNALGTGTVTLNGGTLNLDSATLANNFSVPAGASAIIDNASNNGTLNGSFSGAGTLTLQNSSGAGLSESISNTWSGFTGTLIYNASAGSSKNFNLFGPTGFNFSNGAFVMINTSGNGGSTFRPSGTTQLGSLSGSSGLIQIGTAALQIGNLNTNTVFAGNIGNDGGSGSVTKVGTGTLTLTGGNGYTGATTISGGTLQLGNGGTSGSLSTSSGITDNGTLAFNRSDSITQGTQFSGSAISGSGSLVQSGSGSLTLNTGNTYTGGTIVNSGTLALGYATSGTGTIRGALTINTGAIVNTTVQDALGYTGGVSVTQININGGTLNNGVSFNNGYLANIALTGGTMTSTAGGAFNFNGTGITSNASTATSVISAPLLARNTTNLGFAVASGTTSSGIDLQVSGVISDAGGGITKSGAGNLVLTNTNAYTGATTVSGGTLTLSSTAAINTSSGITINGSGAKFLDTSSVAVSPAVTLTQGTVDGTGTINTLQVANLAGNTLQNGNGGTGTLTIGTLTFNGAAAVNIADSGVATTPGIAVTGTMTTTPASGQVTINASAAVWNSGTTYDLLGFGSFGGLITDFTKGSITGLTSRQSATLVLSGTDLGISIAGDSPKWTGSDNGNWVVGSTGSNHNWRLITTGSATDYIQSDTVLFDDSATGPTTVNISAASVSPTATNFNNNTLNYTITSGGGYGIAGGFLTKSGSGTVTINTSNSYSGGTTINAGVLVVGNVNALGAGLVAVNGGTLDLNGNNITVTALSGSSGGVITNNSTGSNATLTGSSSSSVTYAGALSDGTNGHTLALTNAGSGTLTLTGSSTFTGGVNINGGVLNAGGAENPGVSGPLGSAGTISFGGGTLQYSAADTADYSARFSTAAIQAVSIDTNGQNVAFGTGLTSSGGALAKLGAGTLTLNGVNTYSGATTISAGALTIGGSGQLGSGNYAGNIGLSGTLNYNGTAAQTLSGAISGAGALVQNGPGLLTLTGASPAFTGAAAISSGTLQIGNGTTDGSVANVSGISVANGAALEFNVASSQSASAAISGSGALIKIGGGTLTLSGNSSYSGGTTLNAGTLAVASNNALGTGVLTLNGGALGSGGGSDVTVANNIVVTGSGGAIAIGVGHNLTLTGTLSGAGNVNLNSTSPGTAVSLNWNLAANTMTSGTITMTSGGNNSTVFRLNSPGATSSAVDWVIGGASDRGVPIGTAGTYNFGSLAGTGLLQGNFQSSSTLINLSIGGDNHNATFSGVIANNGPTISVTKVGSGTETLSGANSYSGGTTLNAGTLQIANTHALGTGTLTLAGGTFDNTTGSAFTLPANNAQNWNGNFTFAGSNSLNLGTGAVTLGAASPTVTVNANTLTVGGAIGDSGSGYGITVAGSGTLVLNGSNTFSGPVSVQSGVLEVPAVSTGANPQPLGEGSTVNLGLASTSSGTLDYTGTTSGSLDKNINALGNGGDTIENTGSGLLTLSGTITKNGTVLSLNGGSSGIAVSGIITGTSAGSDLIVTGGVTTLSAANNYNGPTYVQEGGTLVNGNSAGAIPATSNLYVGGTDNSGGTFDLGGNNQTVATLNSQGTGSSVITNNGLTSATLTVNNGGTFAGAIDDNGGSNPTTSLIANSGTLKLSGNNNYNGPTTVNNTATLIVSGELSGTGTVTVNGGATLGGGDLAPGTNTTIAGNVNIATGGTLYPGAGVTTTGTALEMTIGNGNNLTLSDAANIEVNVTGTNPLLNIDYINVSGNVTLSTNPIALDTLTVNLLAAPVPGTVYDFLGASNTISGPAGGSENFAINAILTGPYASQFTATVAYDSSGTAYAVEFTAVPEPGTWATMLGGLGMLLGLQHARRRRL